MDSRPLRTLCPVSRGTIFHICLAEPELRRLGVWGRHPVDCRHSAAVWCRSVLEQTCRRDAATASRIADLLDIQYMNTVLQIRSMPEPEVQEALELWLDQPAGEALPGLLWALCTDARDEIHALGHRLCQEAISLAFHSFVEGPQQSRTA